MVQFITGHFGPQENGDTPVVCIGKPDTLRIGVFFDGTSNSIQKSDTYSNVLKLAMAYVDDRDPNTRKFIPDLDCSATPSAAIYKRGVGTDANAFNDDMLGNAAASGMEARIAGMFYDLREVLYDFRKTYSAFPETVQLDVFGFSRGAATARHFINLITQDHFALEIDANFANYTIEYEVHFVGLFDTVASVGLAGNDIEPGYSMHLPMPRVKGNVVHLIAEDEYRANFDLTTASERQNTDLPEAYVYDGRVEEILCPGAHSDIGGGYSSSFEHGIANNQLARIYLQMMYKKALQAGVPFLQGNDLDDARVKIMGIWDAAPNVQADYDALMDYYRRYGSLREYFKHWRQVNLTMQTAMEIYANPETKNLTLNAIFAKVANLFDESDMPFDYFALKQLRDTYQLKINRLLKDEADAFWQHAKAFYGQYVHINIPPWNDQPGMYPQYATTHVTMLHTHRSVLVGYFQRQTHRTAYIDFAMGNKAIHNISWIGLVLGVPGLIAGKVVASLFDYDPITPIQFDDGPHGNLLQAKAG